MYLVFIDETRFNDMFCVSMVIINSTKYAKLKREYLGVFEKYGWKHDMDDSEFKGNVIFSSTKPEVSKDITVSIRIDICNELLEHVVGKKNKRMDVIFFSHKIKEGESQWKTYFDVVPKLLEKKLKKASNMKGGKNCVAIFCDNFEERGNYKEEFLKMRKEIATILKSKNLTFFEEIFFYPSTSYTMGITYADIIGYLTAKDNFGNERIEKKKEAVEKLLANINNIKNNFQYSEE